MLEHLSGRIGQMGQEEAEIYDYISDMQDNWSLKPGAFCNATKSKPIVHQETAQVIRRSV